MITLFIILGVLIGLAIFTGMIKGFISVVVWLVKFIVGNIGYVLIGGFMLYVILYVVYGLLIAI